MKISSNGGQTFRGDLSRVFHCNHYNTFLQMTILLSEGMPECQPKRLLKDAVTPLIYQLKQQGCTTEELLAEFTFCGFGKLHQIDATTWETPRSHYSEAICLEDKPHHNCFFPAGYIQGLAGQEVEEVICQITGGKVDRFVALSPISPPPSYLLYDPSFSEVPARFTFEDCQAFDTLVDEEEIRRSIAQFPLYGKSGPAEDGLIEVFGVVLTNQFADYYNRISYETYFGMLKSGVPKEHVRELFVQTGLYCAFFTTGGIMESPEWYDLVVPKCRTREDWLHGIVAVLNCLGWGTWRIERMEPESLLIIRVYNSYEGIGYLRMYPITEERNISFLGMGGSLGLAHLLWKIDIRARPSLTWDFYMKHFNDSTTNYKVTQTHAIAAGDEYDRFVISK